MFDEYQNNAILSNENKVLLVASPGSGKTTVLIQKLDNLIDQGIDGNNILLITFTKKACENMKSRFLSKISTSVLPNFYTFHGLFYRIIKQNSYENINIIDEIVVQDFVKQFLKNYTDAVTDYKIDFVLNELRRFRSSGECINEFESRLDKNILKSIDDEYRKFKLKNGLLDFDDFSIKVLNLFKSRKDILDFYKEKFKYILVDEFQDCDNMQFEILKMLSENSKLFCVGDEDQSIYKFRGANLNLMVDFCNIFEGGKKYYLKYNYRSNYSIINFSRNIISNNKMRNDKNLLGKSQEEGEVICKKFLEDREQGIYIANDIEYFIKIGAELSDFAVLYRNHNDSFSVLSEFIKRNVKINFLDSEFNVFEQFYINDIINLLLFIDNPTINNFEKIYDKITFLFTRKIINFINRHDYNSNIFEIVYKNLECISLNDKRSIYDIEKIINNLKVKKLSDKMKFSLNKFGYLTYLDNIIKSRSLDRDDIKYFIDYFYNLLSKFDDIKTFEKGIVSMNSIDGVNFGTIHSSKGMEFKCVYIINANHLNKDSINNHHINVIYDEEEERRIFYVGITRAINKLRILSPYFINGKFIDKHSKFIEEGLKDTDYFKYNIETNHIKKISKSKVLFYDNGKKRKMNTGDFLNIN